MPELTRRKLIGLSTLAAIGGAGTRLFPQTPQNLSRHEVLHPSSHKRLIGSTIQVNLPGEPPHCEGRHFDRFASGFHLGGGIFVTNRHVLFRNKGYAAVDSHMRLAEPAMIGHPDYLYFPVHTATRFNMTDLAVMHTNESRFEFLEPTTRVPRLLEPVYMCTYKEDTRNLHGPNSIHTTRARYAGTTFSGGSGKSYIHSHVITTDVDPEDPVSHIVGGASGSALVDDSGRVFGVIASRKIGTISHLITRLINNVSFENAQHFAFAVPLNTSRVRSYLESHGITYHRP